MIDSSALLMIGRNSSFLVSARQSDITQQDIVPYSSGRDNVSAIFSDCVSVA